MFTRSVPIFDRQTIATLMSVCTAVALMFAPMDVSAVGEGEAERIDDTSIVNAVTKALQNDRKTFGYDVRVESADGIVTLYGTAGNILAKERAANIALTVRGVKSVVNEINVVPDQRSDIAVHEDVDDALLANPRTESYEIQTSVERGFVTLQGDVQSWQEKQLAGNIAKSVKGVKGVVNRLEITYPVFRSDAEIEADVRAALQWDRYIDERFIVVSVGDRQVELVGTVGSAAEKERAVTKSWVSGVDAVDADNLKVRTWAREDDLRQAPKGSVADAKIQAALEDALQLSAHTSPFEIIVDVNDGTVTLNGEVDNLLARRKAGQIAEDTVGVYRVENRLSITVEPRLSEEDLKKSVENALIRDPYIDRFDLSIEVDEATVTLEGDVDNVYEKARAQRLVSGLQGVLDVDNRLKADSDDYLLLDRPYYTGPADDVIYDWHSGGGIQAFGDDAVIEAEIEEELWWSPFVDSGQVNVDVEDGVASLSGTVDSEGERQAAVNNAFEGGAVDVINLLKVEQS